jgi:myo-inositol-1(or 4)-monophosphatase
MLDMVSPTLPIEPKVLATARHAVREAGDLALRWFRPGQGTAAEVSYKHGGSPVTEADLAVDTFLKNRLGAAAPGFGWLSEETVDDSSRLTRRFAWVVDPIDGTRSFARGDADWTVAVGIVADGVPVAGFVYAPVTDEMFEATPGDVSRRNGEPITPTGRDTLSDAFVAGPRPLLDRLVAGPVPFRQAPRIHSLAFRMVRVADGTVDAGLASEKAHDWDLAAAHAILSGAGTTLIGASGKVPTYNRPSTMHEPLAAGTDRLARDLAARIAGPGRDR